MLGDVVMGEGEGEGEMDADAAVVQALSQTAHIRSDDPPS
jgi:hypothetical protein